jgi:hypothetical protein
MVEKMAATNRVLFNGPPAKIAFAHVFAQCDQPTINLLFGNVVSPGGGYSRDDEAPEKAQNYAQEIRSKVATRFIEEGLWRINPCCR